MKMSRLKRDETAETVSRDQILTRERGQGKIHFPCSSDQEQASNLTGLILTLAICDNHTYIYTKDVDRRYRTKVLPKIDRGTRQRHWIRGSYTIRIV